MIVSKAAIHLSDPWSDKPTKKSAVLGNASLATASARTGTLLTIHSGWSYLMEFTTAAPV